VPAFIFSTAQRATPSSGARFLAFNNKGAFLNALNNYWMNFKMVNHLLLLPLLRCSYCRYWCINDNGFITPMQFNIAYMKSKGGFGFTFFTCPGTKHGLDSLDILVI
jgi:hypothetical protein